MLAVAESCTGGLLAATLSDVPGASKSFFGGIIAYHDRIKSSALGLDESKLAKHGAVSAWAVETMAHAVRGQFHADISIAISGVCGPGGGTLRKPVGTVWVAICGPANLIDVRRLKLKGDRGEIRRAAVKTALMAARVMVAEATLEGAA